MQTEGKLTEKLREALNKGLLKRLPLTFLPFVNQQLNQWDYLFPNERQSVERLLLFVSQMTPEQSAGLFRAVTGLEEKMGVRKWDFSTTEQTIQNSSQLASSPYFQQWRQAVQEVFDEADKHARESDSGKSRPVNRLVLIDIPPALHLEAGSAWSRWQGVGRPLKLDLNAAGPMRTALEVLLAGGPSARGGYEGGLLDAAGRRPGSVPADIWVIDAGQGAVETLMQQQALAGTPTKATMLGYKRLDLYRQSFSREMNTMRKDLADADAVFDRLRKVDVSPWSPPELAADPAIREFVRSLFLSGNGAVIFGNSFVEWAASEAIRRARPSFLAARFGVRKKPKPFTGVAVFDNPDQINPLPAQDDLPGSAMDAQMLALYVWLATYRYDEYRGSTVCVCMAESIQEAYVVAPPEFALPAEPEPLQIDRLRKLLHAWIA